MLLYEQYKQTKPSSNIDYFGTIEMPFNVSDSDSGVLWWGAEDDLRDSTG